MRDNLRVNTIFFYSGADSLQESRWQPPVDVYRSAFGWIIKFDLAGIRPEDVTVSFDGSHLSVSGIRRDLFIEEGYSNYLMEISYSRFERGISLKGVVKPARVSTEYHDGMLLVKVTT
jgi:HSP20 family protein